LRHPDQKETNKQTNKQTKTKNALQKRVGLRAPIHSSINQSINRRWVFHIRELSKGKAGECFRIWNVSVLTALFLE